MLWRNGKELTLDAAGTVNMYIDGLEDTVSAAGSSGNDTIRGNLNDNYIVGKEGDDFLWGGDGGNDTMEGNGGNNAYWWGRGSGADSVVSTSSGDVVVAYNVDYASHAGWYEGNDLLLQAGADLLRWKNWAASGAKSRLQSVIYNDNVAYAWNAGAGATVNLYERTYTELGVRHAKSIDSGACFLRGGNGDDLLEGGSGNDQIWGGSGGNDTLVGGTGADTFWWSGADGQDQIAYGSDNSKDTVRLYNLKKQDVTAVLEGEDYILMTANGALTIKGWATTKLQNLQFDDGKYTAESLLTTSAHNNFKITFDYSMDSSGFFTANPYAKACIEKAAKEWTSHINDDFPTVAAGTVSRMRNPVTESYSNITFTTPIDDLVIYVGAHDISDATAWASGATPLSSDSTLMSRYNSTTKAEPWAGSITFDSLPNWADGSSATWWFDPTPETDNDLDVTKYDFVTVAAHEIGHLLGVSKSTKAFAAKCDAAGTYFSGINAYTANNNRNIPLLDGTHPDGYTGNFPTKVVMSYGASYNTDNNRSMVSAIDLAMLKDIGYNII